MRELHGAASCHSFTDITAGIAYGISRGVALGLLDRRFTHTALCAREAVVGCIGTDGLVSNVSDGTPMGHTLDFYRQIPDTPTPYGQALTMLMLVDAMAEIRSAA